MMWQRRLRYCTYTAVHDMVPVAQADKLIDPCNLSGRPFRRFISPCKHMHSFKTL